MKKVLYTTLIIIAIAAFIAAVGRMFNHSNSTTMKDILAYPMPVDTTEHLIVYDITHCRMDLACGHMPDTTDASIILCTAAAFTGQCIDYFEHSNILGSHISNGVLYDGYTETKDGIPYEERYTLFVWKGINQQDEMLEKGFFALPNDSLLLQVAKQGGMAFTQHWVIKDKQIFSPTIQPLDRTEHFRSLCKKGDHFMVIANQQPMPYQHYLNHLLSCGVEDAIYMDMGTGWNHSFYRDADNRLHILHPKTHDYCTNWLVVYKD